MYQMLLCYVADYIIYYANKLSTHQIYANPTMINNISHNVTWSALMWSALLYNINKVW